MGRKESNQTITNKQTKQTISFHLSGMVKKVPNHKEDYGMTDALCCHGNLLYTSAYDLDTGHGYINGKTSLCLFFSKINIVLL